MITRTALGQLNTRMQQGMVEHILEATAEGVVVEIDGCGGIPIRLQKGERITILDRGPDPEAPTDYALGVPTVVIDQI